MTKTRREKSGLRHGSLVGPVFDSAKSGGCSLRGHAHTGRLRPGYGAAAEASCEAEAALYSETPLALVAPDALLPYQRLVVVRRIDIHETALIVHRHVDNAIGVGVYDDASAFSERRFT